MRIKYLPQINNQTELKYQFQQEIIQVKVYDVKLKENRYAVNEAKPGQPTKMVIKTKVERSLQLRNTYQYDLTSVVQNQAYQTNQYLRYIERDSSNNLVVHLTLFIEEKETNSSRLNPTLGLAIDSDFEIDFDNLIQLEVKPAAVNLPNENESLNLEIETLKQRLTILTIQTEQTNI